MASRTNEEAMISEKVAPVLVARTLGPFDLVVIFVAIVLFINNAAGVQAAGPSVFIFWILAFATFLITGGFVTAQLGRMFPEEGSLYVWTHKVLGPFWGFFAGFVAWWPGPVSLVFIGILVANFLQQFATFFTCNGQPCTILTKNWEMGIVVLVVVWFSASMAYLKMRGTQTVGLAIGKWAGAAVSLVLAWVVLTVAVVYNYSFGRLLFVSGMEKRLPHQFGKVNANKVPANAITLQTVISTILAVFVFFIVGRGGSDPYKAFYVLYAGVTIVWCISTALLFLDIFFAKRAEPERFERERRISLGWLYVCGAAGFVVNVLAVMFIFVGSWYPTGFPILRVWNEWMLAFTAVSVISGITIYLISQRTRRGKTDVEFLGEGAATQEIAEDTPMA